MTEAAPMANKQLDYYHAWLYTITCTHNNKYDWRFPLQDELDQNNIPTEMFWFTNDFYLSEVRRYIFPVRDKND